MRVLHVISNDDSRAGGPAVAMSGLCKAQRAAGLDVAVLATFRSDSRHDLADELRAGGVDVTLIGPTHGPLAAHPQLAAAAQTAVAAADVIHIHALWESVQYEAAKSAQRAAKPYLFTPHGMLTPWSLRQKALKKKLYMALRLRRYLDRASALHFTTAQERDDTAQLRLAPPPIVEPLGVDLREFQTLPPRGSFRAKHPQLAGRKIVMFLGRLHPGKGMEYLIPAFAQVKMDDAVLVAVGPDSHGFQATLQAMVDQHGVGDRVFFTGMLRGADRIEALADADLFALPSEHENFGVAVIEALACGVPVVISTGVAIAGEIVAAGVGAAVPVEVDRIAAEVRRWLADEDLRRAAAEKARRFVWEKFDWSTVARNWVGHYSRLAAAGPPR